MNVKRGEIYYIKKYPTCGTEQNGGRPFIVVTPNELLTNGTGALCAPLTTKPKKLLPQHRTIHINKKPSTVLCEQMRYIDESLFGEYYGTASEEEMKYVEEALIEAVGVKIPKITTTSASSPQVPNQNNDDIKALREELAAKDLEIFKLNAQIEAYIGLLKK